ncbi:MAG: hypothetical protein LDL44_19545, partial [Caenispirillum sp.]|nr:hypothetical protein [Caenispirillum sp.]
MSGGGDDTVDLAAFPRRIHELPDRWRRERPAAPALVDFDGRELDYAALGDAVDAAERVLRE